VSPTAERVSSRQYLPIPLGGMAPTHAHVRPILRLWSRHRLPACTGVGLLLSALGTWLLLARAPAEIYADGHVVYFAGSKLTQRVGASGSSTREFIGDIALVVRTRTDGLIRASAVARLDGQAASGICDLNMRAVRPIEACEFHLGARTLTSVDVYDARDRLWRRRYSDGHSEAFRVPAGSALIPVALPLGR